MGYTHYWRHAGLADHPKLVAAIADMRKVVAEGGAELEQYEPAGHEVHFNGATQDEQCEDFLFPGDAGFAFCKTRAYPYDNVATACLAIAAELLPVKVSSDGDAEEWASGVALASRVLGRAVPNPINDESEDE